MRLKILPKGITGDPLVLDASLVLVETAEGTPIMVAGEFGPDGTYKAAHAGDNDFNKTLQDLGINKTTICDTLKLPAPPTGARIIHGPNR